MQIPALHVSVVQALESAQAFVLSAGCVQAPPPQTSTVHGFPSSAQATALFVCVHTLPTQSSSVQALPSLHSLGSVHVVVVVNVQREPVVVELPSEIVTYHSKDLFMARPGHEMQVWLPLGTPVLAPRLANGSPASMS